MVISWINKIRPFQRGINLNKQYHVFNRLNNQKSKKYFWVWQPCWVLNKSGWEKSGLREHSASCIRQREDKPPPPSPEAATLDTDLVTWLHQGRTSNQCRFRVALCALPLLAKLTPTGSNFWLIFCSDCFPIAINQIFWQKELLSHVFLCKSCMWGLDDLC